MAKRNMDLPGWPRGLTVDMAAAYIGVSTGLFYTMVRNGRMPAAVEIGRRRVWDIQAVDLAFTKLGGAENFDWTWSTSGDDVDLGGPPPARKLKNPPTLNEAVSQKWCPPEYEKYRGEPWFETAKFYKEGEWEALVKSRPLNKRELIGLEGYFNGKGQTKLEIKGCSINTVELLVIRGYLQVVAERGEGKVPYYGITPEGEAIWQELRKIGPPCIA